MLIKIIKNNVESEWFELTKAQHRALLNDQPEAAIVKIEELYPGSPDEGKLVRLSFSVFTELTREFVLEENKQEKQAERYHDKRPLEEIKGKDYQSKLSTLENDLLQSELLLQLKAAGEALTPVEKRRLSLYISGNYSLRRIADLEGVHFTTVDASIRSAIKKIKKILN